MTIRRFLDQVKRIIKEPGVLKNIYVITLLMALFILALVVRGPEQKGNLIKNENGEIKGIERYSLENSETYDVVLRIQNGNEVTEQEVTLVLKPYSDSGTDNAAMNGPEEISKAEQNSQIDGMITELEYSQEKELVLPTRLADGTAISWYSASPKHNPAILFIPIIYVILILLTIKSRMDEDVNREVVIRKEIMHDLPRFCNQMFLMMNAGMILNDAFEKICASYLEIGDEERSWFQSEMINVYQNNCDHRKGVASVLTEFAAGYNVKELTRIATILAVNEKRGSDIVENLSQESKYLWDDRKLVARESGKAIDMKMSYPLGALLILLIVITMAPAMLNI